MSSGPRTAVGRIRQIQQQIPQCEFSKQLKFSQDKRQQKHLVTFKPIGPLMPSDVISPTRLGDRFLSDDQLIALALEIRRLPDKEYAELVKTIAQKLTANPVGKPLAPPPTPLLPRRIPFPHPLPLFGGLAASCCAPCVNPVNKTMPPLLYMIQMLASTNSGGAE